MPDLVQGDVEDMPKNISNLSKEEFIRMMMRESYHSQAEASIKDNLKSNKHHSVTSKLSADASLKHNSNESHINIISNSSSK